MYRERNVQVLSFRCFTIKLVINFVTNIFIIHILFDWWEYVWYLFNVLAGINIFYNRAVYYSFYFISYVILGRFVLIFIFFNGAAGPKFSLSNQKYKQNSIIRFWDSIEPFHSMEFWRYLLRLLFSPVTLAMFIKILPTFTTKFQSLWNSESFQVDRRTRHLHRNSLNLVWAFCWEISWTASSNIERYRAFNCPDFTLRLLPSLNEFYSQCARHFGCYPNLFILKGLLCSSY